LLREPLERAVQRIKDGIQPNGGFDYQYRKENRNDISVGVWHVQALAAAVIALPDNDDIERLMNNAMDGVLAGSGRRDGGRFFTYSVNDPSNIGGPHQIVTSGGSLALFLSGRHRDRETREAMQFMRQFVESDRLPQWDNEDVPNLYGGQINLWYYAIQAFFHENPDGRNFRRYMPAMVRALAQNQAEDGHWRCYTRRGGSQGPVYNTTLAALGLMVYYRYLPTTQVENIRGDQDASPADAQDEDEVGFQI